MTTPLEDNVLPLGWSGSVHQNSNQSHTDNPTWYWRCFADDGGSGSLMSVGNTKDEAIANMISLIEKYKAKHSDLWSWLCYKVDNKEMLLSNDMNLAIRAIVEKIREIDCA